MVTLPYLNTIINGDTLTELKKLPDCIVDAGVTSPPYNKMEKNNGGLVKSVVYDKYRDCLNEDEYQENQIDVLNELFRITKPGGSLFYNHKIRWDNGKLIHPIEWLSKSNWTIRQEIIWDRGIASNIRGWRFWQVEERIYWLYRPVDGNLIGTELDSKDALLTSIWRIPPEQASKHPAPFPVELPTRCLASVANCGDVVIDPYSGSGTTLSSAKNLGMNYIGIELSTDYIEMANERLVHYLDDKKRIDEELEKHTVTKTFQQRKQDKQKDDFKESLW